MRNLPADIAAEFSSTHAYPVILIEMYFDEATLRMFTGYGMMNFNGEDYYGMGNFIGISAIEETQDTTAKGVVVSLNGIPSELLSVTLSARCRGRPFRMYLSYINTKQSVATEHDDTGIVLTEDGNRVLLENQVVGNPYRIFSGLMDVIEFNDGGSEAFLRLSVENALIIGQRPKIRRYTKEDQRKTNPSDRGLDFINQLQDKEIVW